MTKELREDVDRIIRDVNMAAGSRVDEIVALFDRYATEREKKARKNGYNAGWSTRNKTKPKIHRCICDSCRVIQEAALKEIRNE